MAMFGLLDKAVRVQRSYGQRLNFWIFLQNSCFADALWILLLTRNYNNAKAIIKGIFRNAEQLQDRNPVLWKHESQSERQFRIEANQLPLEMHSLCQLPFLPSEQCPC